MIEIPFSQFYEQQYSDEGYSLYVMKDGDNKVLYVGISSTDIWERWFDRIGSHMIFPSGCTSVGQMIERNMPESLNWPIQLWTTEECVDFCKSKRRTLNHVEKDMIQKLAPKLNGTHNYHHLKDTSPITEAEKEHRASLRKTHKDIFG